MARVRFEFDPDFDDNVYRASNKSGSSLRPLYDQVRRITDRIAENAKSAIETEYANAEADTSGKRDNATHGDGKTQFLRAKARAFALRSAANSTVPTMGYDGKEIYGRVIINRKGSFVLEYGGPDPVAEIGKGTGEYLVHPAYAFLRRAMDRT
jgi:hypothetical protein